MSVYKVAGRLQAQRLKRAKHVPYTVLLTYLALIVLITTILCELAAKREWLPYWVSRKILHIVAVGACAVAGYYADSLRHRELLIWIVAGAEVLLLGLIGFGGLMREESGRRPWGIVWFPLAFLVLLILPLPGNLVGLHMAILAICDPAATIAGKLLSNRNNQQGEGILDQQLVKPSVQKSPWFLKQYNLTGDPKSFAGNLAFILAFIIVGQLYFYLDEVSNYFWDEGPTYLDVSVYAALFMASIVVAATEALGSKGIDNLFVPLGSALIIHLFSGKIEVLMITLPIAALFTYFTIRRQSLSPGGAVTASLMGIMVVLSTGPIWLLPLLLFFASSSLIGKVLPSKSAAGDAKQKQPRDATQVLANGAVYAAIAIFLYQDWDNGLLYLMRVPWEYYLLVAVAVATADTWSSEIGQYFRRPTWDLVKWRRVPAGLSGGVSWPGTLAGLAGASFIALTCCWLLPSNSGKNILMVVSLGFGGMLIDSILGSLLQATYRAPKTGALSDVCPPGGELISGFRWMTNDLVNFLAILITVALSTLIPFFW